ncbi:MAG: hypothetical protein AAF208_13160 [Cyanobacteria bacterium P01_A01_bin.45]
MLSKVIKEGVKSLVLEVTENPTVAAITGAITGVLLGLYFQDHSESSYSFGEAFHFFSDKKADLKEVLGIDLDSLNVDNYSEYEIQNIDILIDGLDTEVALEKHYHVHYLHEVDIWSKSLQAAGAS